MCEQKDIKTGELEGLSYEFDLCEAVATWEQVSVLSLVEICDLTLPCHQMRYATVHVEINFFFFVSTFSMLSLVLFYALQLICYSVS